MTGNHLRHHGSSARLQYCGFYAGLREAGSIRLENEKTVVLNVNSLLEEAEEIELLQRRSHTKKQLPTPSPSLNIASYILPMLLYFCPVFHLGFVQRRILVNVSGQKCCAGV